MGHDIDTHTKSYHRWLTEADVAAFVASRKKLDKKNPRYSEGFGLPVSARFGFWDLARSLLRRGARKALRQPVRGY